jgi:[ribosomal protein S18]-alanine N-acetyltransferase
MNGPLSLSIRPMEGRDLDRIVEIADGLGTAPDWTRAAYTAALDASNVPRRVALVAGISTTGEIAGFAVASLIPPEAELEVIAVVPTLQRRGIAGKLFEAVEEELVAAQVKRILLEVRASNVAALGLYRSLGFGEVGRRGAYYADPVEDAIILRREIG